MIPPTERRVREKCECFDKRNETAERALKDLFAQYPRNEDHAHVLLKVVALNRLYSTNIYAVEAMAAHIFNLGQKVDSALAEGSPDIVDEIARLTLDTGKIRNNYSFATKYCSWHNQTAYPVWDSRVNTYLRLLRREYRVMFLPARGYLWEKNSEFVNLMKALQELYGLESFTFKEIDKFIWTEMDEPPLTALSAGAETAYANE